MAYAALSRLDVKCVHDSLATQGQYPLTDELCVTLGDAGLKATIHRCPKELEEKEGTALARIGSLSDTTQDLGSAGGVLG